MAFRRHGAPSVMERSDAIWLIAGLSIMGVIARPWRLPEWIWAVGGAAMLVVAGLMSWQAAASAIGRGTDVYLFLAGMMLLSETARDHGVFDWIAAIAVARAKASPARLFALIYSAGTIITVFLSNDATAVVLTPAVFAAARRARVDAVPPLFACAMVANAASFVLPFSNPANLVIYGGHLPALARWIGAFALPSVAAIATTFAVLRVVMRSRLSGRIEAVAEPPHLTAAGRAALVSIVMTAPVLLTASALGLGLGLPTALAGLAATLTIAAAARRSPIATVRQVSWGVLLLVAGLFVLVGALRQTDLISTIAAALRMASADTFGHAAAGAVLAVVCNVVNNLPAGLIAATAIAQAHPPRLTIDALLIGVDLGPNLSVTGSLATILWLQAIRREGGNVRFRQFLGIGAIAMPLALAAALTLRLAV